MVRLQDEPIADPVCVPVYYVSKLARDNGVIVCQVGEGADELFWGYPGWKTMLDHQALRRPARSRESSSGQGLQGLRARWERTGRSLRMAATRGSRAARYSGEAPRRSPRRRRGACFRRGSETASRCSPRGMCLQPIREPFRGEGVGAVQLSTG